MNSSIDINCDLGEGGPHDEALLDYVTSANIACGVHAGDATLMRRTMELAAAKGVAIGAHPGVAGGMGRGDVKPSPQDAADLMTYQVGAMAAVAQMRRLKLRHVKPHGTLYNLAACDEDMARAVVRAVIAVDERLIVFALAGGALEKIARGEGLAVAREAFADRRYLADGTLAPRGQDGAVIDDPRQGVQQALRLIREHKLTAVDGTELEIHADTICVHSDSPGALTLLRMLRQALAAQNIQVARFP